MIKTSPKELLKNEVVVEMLPNRFCVTTGYLLYNTSGNTIHVITPRMLDDEGKIEVFIYKQMVAEDLCL